MSQITERLLAGDRRALARLITLIESEAPVARQYLAELHPHTGQAHIVGITGSPGAGKSTLVTHLVRELRGRGQRIGVVAVDPSSPFSGGALLGDRIRMMELAGDPQVFIRSMASRGSLGGLAASTRDVIRALDASGYNPIIIETVGTGQAEVEIMSTASTVLVVCAPGMGDEIQAIKAGILEIADLFVVSKADRSGADQTAAELAMLLSLDPMRKRDAVAYTTWRIPIIKTSAITGEGFAKLADAIQQHRAYLTASGQLAERVTRQVDAEVQALIQHIVRAALARAVSHEEWRTLVAEIVAGERDPYSVACALAQRLGLPQAT